MITQVSGFNTRGVASGLKQNNQAMPFTHSSVPAVQPDCWQNSNQQQNKSPIWTGTSIVLGSVLFMIAYFLISGAKRA